MLQSHSLLTPHTSRNNDDNMIPLINIVFLLLIFFMVAGQIRALPNAELVLPKAALEQAEGQSDLRLEVSQQGDMTLDGIACTAEQLATRLQALPQPSSVAVGIFADQRATAAALENALAVVRQFSFQSVRLYAEAPEGTVK
ncbi:ExbD/TolR family protein [Candidatus Thalassolituus haligoni]|uniref:ExbD/TolR family protein n=1 Tax=Candidatus Thalassolituus haligoni TaxID=3100113 RepID=UPI003515550A